MLKKIKDKEKGDETEDFSPLAKRLLEIVIERLDPISFHCNEVFTDSHWSGCFSGKSNSICSCRLNNIDGDFYEFVIGLFNGSSKTKPGNIFIFSVPKRNSKKNKLVCGKAVVEGYSYRDENYFSFKHSSLYNKYLNDIIYKNFIGVNVQAEGDLGSGTTSFVDRSPIKKKIAIPNIKYIKTMLKNISYDRHGRLICSDNAKTKK